MVTGGAEKLAFDYHENEVLKRDGVILTGTLRKKIKITSKDYPAY